MSHQSFAAIWSRLETRTDIDSVICELIGQNNLESSVLANDSAELLDSSLRLTVFIKVIFDLQRTYSLESSHLLQPRQLFLTVVYILRIKCRVFRRSEDTSAQYVAQRSFMAQALVSGLRALWLRKYFFSDEEITQLRSTFQEAWNGEELNDLDKFIIRTLCPRILEKLSDPQSELSLPACGDVQLRDYRTGLYPLESRPDELVVPVSKASSCLHLSDSNWLRSYWTLFDIAWTTEAALIQLCVNSSRPRDSTKLARPTQDDIQQLRITRMKVLGAIFGSPTTDAAAKAVVNGSIAAILLTPCFEGNCNCLERQSAHSDHPGTISAKSTSLEAYQRGNPNIAMSQFLNESLACLVTALESRKEGLRDCNGELSDLSDSLDDYMDAWYSDISSIRSTNSGSRRARRVAYIVPCPELHPIPYDILEGLVAQSAGKVGLKDLKNNSPLFQVDISCSECNSQHRIEWVRQIEPLRRLSATIDEKLQRKPLNQRQWYQGATPIDHLQRNSSGNFTLLSSGSTGSHSTSLSEKSSTQRQGRLEDFFDESPKRPGKHLRIAPSYSFSADGQSVLLWIRNGAQVVLYDIDSRKVEKFSANNVGFAVAGPKFYAVISINGDVRDLHLHQRSDEKLVTSVPFNDAPVYCIALSRNEKFVALGFATEVRIYQIENHQIENKEGYCHTLPPMKGSKLESQRLCFSADSETVMVATRDREGNVYTYVNECTRQTTGRNLPLVKIPMGHGNDFGLSSVLYDKKSDYACITAFTRRTPPTLFSLQSRTPLLLDDKYHRHLGTQIQCAAQCPCGRKLILVNHENEIFSVQRDAESHWHVEKIKLRPARKAVVNREEIMAVSMPNEDTVHLFWIKGEEWGLMTVEGNQNPGT